MNCVIDINLLTPETKGEHKKFSTAIETFDYLKANNFEGIITGLMPWEERIKFCRWINGARCVNNHKILTPVMEHT